jgi:hypothetical protein
MDRDSFGTLLKGLNRASSHIPFPVVLLERLNQILTGKVLDLVPNVRAETQAGTGREMSATKGLIEPGMTAPLIRAQIIAQSTSAIAIGIGSPC